MNLKIKVGSRFSRVYSLGVFVPVVVALTKTHVLHSCLQEEEMNFSSLGKKTKQVSQYFSQKIFPNLAPEDVQSFVVLCNKHANVRAWTNDQLEHFQLKY